MTRDEVRIIFYMDGGYAWTTNRGLEYAQPIGSYTDLATPPAEDDSPDVRALRIVQRYFNERFQTYGRFVHLFLHVGPHVATATAEERRADAADEIARIKPFAVVSGVSRFSADYAAVMNRRGVPVFLAQTFSAFGSMGPRQEMTRRGKGLLWSYLPTIEQRAELFTSYVCKKVLGLPTSFSGNSGENGTPRVLGLLRSDNDSLPELISFGLLVKAGIEACGGRFAAEGLTRDQWYATTDADDRSRAQTQMAEFASKGVTTVIWAAGSGIGAQDAAGSSAYYPEWVVAGDSNLIDSTFGAQRQREDVWQYARAVSTHTFTPTFAQRDCVQAARSSEPSEAGQDIANFFCQVYPYFRQLFIGIQVAGPELTPRSMDRGFHAIPDVPSSHPTVAACFYELDDYSCVKDAMAIWWDPGGINENGSRGCWRAMEGGRRYLRGSWPAGDVEQQRTPSDPCTILGTDIA